VAMLQAHKVFFLLGIPCLSAPGLLVIDVPVVAAGPISVQAAEVFEDFRVEDGGADPVNAGGPLAEVDLAAAVGAEGEVLIGEANQHAAGGAAVEFGGFFLDGHGLVPAWEQWSTSMVQGEARDGAAERVAPG